MSNFDDQRRILIIDDQSHIHETFARIFDDDKGRREDLDDFEARFLDDVEQENSTSSNSAPQFLLTHTYSGEEGLRHVRDAMEAGNRYSVAFVDMRMPPGLDGLETTQRIWELDPDVQVVVCTAYSDHTWDDIVETLGYNDRLLLLRKPFEHDEARQLALALSEKFRLSIHQKKRLSQLESEVQRRRQAESELRKMAHRDALTSLPNRPFLIERLESLLRRKKTAAHRINDSNDAILFLDLDNFKIINDSLGHEAGDDLLNQVAVRLQECVREHDSASNGNLNDLQSGRRPGDETIRLGGDEFVVLLEGLSKQEHALNVAQRIVMRISEPFQLSGRLVTVGTSVGVAFIDGSITDAHDALRNADTAMYRAKNTGKGQIAVFDQTMHDAVVARHELEAQLRKALAEQEFELRYQPIVNLQSGKIQGIEVLSRWRGSDGEYVPPSEFVPVAEEIGLINHFGEWVLEAAMLEFNTLMNSLPKELQTQCYLGVNISRRQLGDTFFIDRLQAIIESTQFRGTLKLETSESGDSRHDERSLQTMLSLHDRGVGIHIDDFGKGSSSLMCFHEYPIEAVKIDRSFTASVATEQGHAIIAQAIVQLAHHLSAKVVCQGIESERQMRLLQKWSCDGGQGYFFAPPLDINELRVLLLDPSKNEGIRSVKQSFTTLITLPISNPSNATPIVEL